MRSSGWVLKKEFRAGWTTDRTSAVTTKQMPKMTSIVFSL